MTIFNFWPKIIDQKLYMYTLHRASNLTFLKLKQFARRVQFFYVFTPSPILYIKNSKIDFLKIFDFGKISNKGPPLSLFRKNFFFNFRIASFHFLSIAEVKICTKQGFKSVLDDI